MAAMLKTVTWAWPPDEETTMQTRANRHPKVPHRSEELPALRMGNEQAPNGYVQVPLEAERHVEGGKPVRKLLIRDSPPEY